MYVSCQQMARRVHHLDVVGDTGFLVYNISKSLAALLNPRVVTTNFHIWNSKQLLEEFEKVQLEEDGIFNSHDVICLFTKTHINQCYTSTTQSRSAQLLTTFSYTLNMQSCWLPFQYNLNVQSCWLPFHIHWTCRAADYLFIYIEPAELLTTFSYTFNVQSCWLPFHIHWTCTTADYLYMYIEHAQLLTTFQYKLNVQSCWLPLHIHWTCRSADYLFIYIEPAELLTTFSYTLKVQNCTQKRFCNITVELVVV